VAEYRRNLGKRSLVRWGDEPEGLRPPLLLGETPVPTAEPGIPTPTPETETPTPTPEPDLTGDVNGDGAVNIIDALLVAQFYVGLDPENFDVDNADTNCDGSINIVDALLVAQYYVDLISELC